LKLNSFFIHALMLHKAGQILDRIVYYWITVVLNIDDDDNNNNNNNNYLFAYKFRYVSNSQKQKIK
jgi:hypothetical protein